MILSITTECPYCHTANVHEIEFEVVGKNAIAVACYDCDGFYAIITHLSVTTAVHEISEKTHA